jgi:osmoprotectant transport system ATP-binding protein
MGYAVQGAGLFPHLTIKQNVTLVAMMSGWSKSRINERYSTLLSFFGLDDELSDRYPHSLSGGQQQRVGLCRAMMLEPPLLLLDEPFSALDPITRASIHEEMLRLKDVSILLVTHDMTEAARLAEHLVILKDGQVVQQGSFAQITSEPANDYVSLLIGSGNV